MCMCMCVCLYVRTCLTKYFSFASIFSNQIDVMGCFHYLQSENVGNIRSYYIYVVTTLIQVLNTQVELSNAMIIKHNNIRSIILLYSLKKIHAYCHTAYRGILTTIIFGKRA